MKTLTKSLTKERLTTAKDVFFVLLGISVILLTVLVLEYYHFIKYYVW